MGNADRDRHIQRSQNRAMPPGVGNSSDTGGNRHLKSTATRNGCSEETFCACTLCSYLAVSKFISQTTYYLLGVTNFTIGPSSFLLTWTKRTFAIRATGINCYARSLRAAVVPVGVVLSCSQRIDLVLFPTGSKMHEVINAPFFFSQYWSEVAKKIVSSEKCTS